MPGLMIIKGSNCAAAVSMKDFLPVQVQLYMEYSISLINKV
jgi:hypothetical protein